MISKLLQAWRACSSPTQESLLLSWVGDLWDWRHHPVWWVTDAAVVAITNCKDCASAPKLSQVLSCCWLLGHLHELVEMDPSTTTRALVTQSLLGHEVV